MPEDDALKSSRPKIFVGGQEVPELTAEMQSLVIAENTIGLYHCEAKFGNWGSVNNNPDFQKRLRLGYILILDRI